MNRPSVLHLSLTFALLFLAGCNDHRYFTQDFAVGENNLEGYLLQLWPAPTSSYYELSATLIDQLPHDPSEDQEADVSGGSRVLELGPDSYVEFYGSRYDTVVLGADGTIGIGEGGDNRSLATHFAHKQVSLLPVASIGTGSVTYEVLDRRSLTVTYRDVLTDDGALATAQAAFFTSAALYGGIALSYETISRNAAGIVGLSNSPAAPDADLDQILADFRDFEPPLIPSTMTGTLPPWIFRK